VGSWSGDDSSSTWIGPNNDPYTNSVVGIYDYRITFDLTGFNPATASITAQWSADNLGTEILVNGVSTGITAGGFAAWYPVSINTGFVAGVNTLDFLVSNTLFGPTGLRVEGAVTADPASAIPEPASMLLLGGGLVAFGMFRKRLA
jgi:hypothetical protein